MISVAEALERVFALVEPTPVETVRLREAAGRVLARPLAATRDQPPFAASAMDGYAVHANEVREGARWQVAGEVAAGGLWLDTLAPGTALRIFTGAPVPPGADCVVIQENVTRRGDVITLANVPDAGTNIRPAGADFHKGDGFEAPRRLRPADIALLASMNHATVPVHLAPELVLLATGDELVEPGEEPGPGQIIASNSYGLAALFEAWGAQVRMLPIARDTEASIATALDLAKGADLIVSIGGASVGDYDLVGPVATALGMESSFYKVAIRPGKPLMAGKLHGAAMVGLPGNPVSAMVCGIVFILPMLAAMQGLPARPLPRLSAPLVKPLDANGPREHYMRARLMPDGIAAFERQDSSLLGILSQADALIVRAPGASAAGVGDEVEYIPL